MVGTTNGAALLAFWAPTVATSRGANTMDPTTAVKRQLRHRQQQHVERGQFLAQEETRSKRLGAPVGSSSSSLLDTSRGLQQEDCILEGNLYGTFEGNNRNVEFLYQGVFAADTSQTQIILNILPNLERDIVKGVLPAFFDCPGEEPTGLINGISPTDADSLSVGGTYRYIHSQESFFCSVKRIQSSLTLVL